MKEMPSLSQMGVRNRPKHLRLESLSPAASPTSDPDARTSRSHMPAHGRLSNEWDDRLNNFSIRLLPLDLGVRDWILYWHTPWFGLDGPISLSADSLPALGSGRATSLFLACSPGFDHVSRTISVHMAQDDSTYRGRNGIGCFHVSP